MPLVPVPLHIDYNTQPPAEVMEFLREASIRINEFQSRSLVPAFVPGDYIGSYYALRALADSVLIRGNRFLEWGSGFGVVTGLAGWLGFESYGVEISAELVAAAGELTGDFDLPAEFVCGSFVPRGADDWVGAAGRYAWMTTDADDAYTDLGLDPDDFDVVFAYPWPDEEIITADLFEHYAGAGALLVTFHSGDGFRMRRKVARKRRRG